MTNEIFFGNFFSLPENIGIGVLNGLGKMVVRKFSSKYGKFHIILHQIDAVLLF